MKETIKINLAQRLFDLDEDAYNRLRDYLDSLNQYFRRSSEEAEDILFDIEQRIAELLDEKLGDRKQVVTLQDVEEIIQKMGTAEDFARDTEFSGDQPSSEAEKEGAREDFSREHRHLFRDVENNILGGVCTGLAAYFNIDSIWIRLAFVALFFMNLIGLILYVILWVIVPPALTRSQKLRMEGKPVNIGNIEESVKNEFHRVKDNFSKFSQSDTYRRTRDTTGEVLRSLGHIFLVILKVIVVLVGVGFAVAGLALLISLIAALTAGTVWTGWHFPGIHIGQEFLPFFQNMTLFSVAVFLVILIPVVAILAALIRLIFNVRKGNSVLSAFAWTFWSLALVFVFITLIMGENGINFGYHYKDTRKLRLPEKKILYLRLDEDNSKSTNMEYYTIFGKDIIHDKWGDSFLLEPEIEIVKANDKSVKVVMQYSALIPWDQDVKRYPYHYTMNDSVLILDNYWTIDEDELWRLPRLKVVVYLPESRRIHLDGDFRNISTRTEEGDKWPDWYYGSVLIMENDGLHARNK